MRSKKVLSPFLPITFLLFLLATSLGHSETETLGNIRKLNELAKTLLSEGGTLQKEINEELSSLGLDPTMVPKLQDFYQVHIPESTECFYENDLRVLSDWDISGGGDLEIMKQNVAAAARFLKEIHLSARGQDLGYFHPRVIDLCPSAMMKSRTMFYQGRKLTIGLANPKGWDQYERLSSKGIMDGWDRGDIFANNDDDSGLLERAGDKVKALLKDKDPRTYGKKAWFLINPVGKVRSALRELLQKKSRAFKDELAKTRNRSDLDALVDQHLDGEKVRGEMPGEEEPRKWIASLSDAELRDFRSLWLKQLSSTSVTEAIAQSVLEEMQSPVYSEEIEISVVQKGKLLAVENAHFIQASLTLTTERVKRFVTTTVPRKMKINIHQEADITISTKDIISAFAQIVLPKSKMVESISFLEVRDTFERLRRVKEAGTNNLFDERNTSSRPK